MIFDDGGLLRKFFSTIAFLFFFLWFGLWSIVILGMTIVIAFLLEDILFNTEHFK